MSDQRGSLKGELTPLRTRSKKLLMVGSVSVGAGLIGTVSAYLLTKFGGPVNGLTAFDIPAELFRELVTVYSNGQSSGGVPWEGAVFSLAKFAGPTIFLAGSALAAITAMTRGIAAAVPIFAVTAFVPVAMMVGNLVLGSASDDEASRSSRNPAAELREDAKSPSGWNRIENALDKVVSAKSHAELGPLLSPQIVYLRAQIGVVSENGKNRTLSVR